MQRFDGEVNDTDRMFDPLYVGYLDDLDAVDDLEASDNSVYGYGNEAEAYDDAAPGVNGDRDGIDHEALAWSVQTRERNMATGDKTSRNGARPQQSRQRMPSTRRLASQQALQASPTVRAAPQPRLSRSSRLWRSYRVASLLLRTLYIINRERARVTRARERGDHTVRPDIQALLRVLREFRKTAVELGGLLIKLGQFLGARADLLPAEALAELATLQDDVAPEPFAAIHPLIERELAAPLDELFAEFNPKPEGAASLGQVHKARLHDGRLVAVKVQRPGIVQIVQADLSVLRFVLEIVRRLAPAVDHIADLRALYREFARTVYEELDYQHEGRNAERFAAIFTDDPLIAVPEVVWTYSTGRVLTLEWMEGIKITQVNTLDVAGVDRDALARRLAGSYFRQTLEAGFFHADPHPGNILVQPLIPGRILHAYKQPPASNTRSAAQAQPQEVTVRIEPGMARIVFLDFGMMGVVTPQMRGGLRDCLTGAVQRDATRFTRGLDSLGFLSPNVDHVAIERVIAAMIAQFAGRPVSQLGQVDPREALGDVRETLYEHPFRLPAEFAFFGRMVGILFGLTASLSPNINFIEVASPYAQQFLRRDGLGGLLSLLGVESLGALGQETLRESVALARSLVQLPRRLDHVLTQVERGDLHIDITPTLPGEATGPWAPGGRHRRSRRTRAVGNLLSYPTPAWLTVGMAGASVLAMIMLLRRRDSSIKWSELLSALTSRGPLAALKGRSPTEANGTNGTNGAKD
ncbi:MAG: AarF/ABC1/UbiB kinase family protein [Ktedonobacterales bacterium]